MEQYTTQLLVIGGGASGLAAAAAAAEKGARVIVAESMAAVGGNGLFPRGVFAVDSVLQRKRLIFADTDEIFTRCMEYSHWKIDGRLVRRLLDKSGDTISWLMDKGVDFCDVVHHTPNQAPEVFHITSAEENAGSVVIRCLKKFCLEHGVTLLTHTRGKQLTQDDHGAVTGAICEKKDGTEVHISAERVIICTGGFSGNQKMIRKYYPGFKPEYVAKGGGMRHPGDGVRMALEAGADIEGNFAMEIAAPKIQGYAALNLILGKPYHMWLNRFGQRFASEGIVYNFAQAANACLRQPEGKMWVVFGQRQLDQALSDGRDMIELIHIDPKAEEQLPQTMEKAIADGVMVKAENTAQLAAFIGCPQQAVEASLTEYNVFCRHGRDAMFAKDRRYLTPLGDGPLYAIRAGADMLITHGGVRVNEYFQALNDQYQQVENLYIAGVDFGGVDADEYNVEMSGHGFGFALNSGRMAGEHAAEAVLHQ